MPAHLTPVSAQHLGEGRLWIEFRTLVSVLQASQPAVRPLHVALVWRKTDLVYAAEQEMPFEVDGIEVDTKRRELARVCLGAKGLLVVAQ